MFRFLKVYHIYICVCVCVCVCWEMQGERVVLTVFSAIFPSNNALVPLAPNSVFLKLTWGNPSTVSFSLDISRLSYIVDEFFIAEPPFWRHWGENQFLCLFQVLVAIGILWFVALSSIFKVHHSKFYFHCRMTFFGPPSYTDTLWWCITLNLDNTR